MRSAIAATAVLGIAAAATACGSTYSSSTPAAPRVTVTAPPVNAAPPAAAPPSAPGATARPTPAGADPAAVVTRYFAAINAHDYKGAWALGANRLGGSYNQFVAGLKTTTYDQVSIFGVNGRSVAVQVAAFHPDGSADLFEGAYTVGGATITAAHMSLVGMLPATTAPSPSGGAPMPSLGGPTI